jgi:dihydroorotase
MPKDIATFGVTLCASIASAQPPYSLLLKGGHVIDSKNQISGIRDVAAAAGKIAAMAESGPEILRNGATW